MTRTEIQRRMRVARKAIKKIDPDARRAGKWEVQDWCGNEGRQRSKLCGVDEYNWDGGMTSWADAISRIIPGETMVCCCYDDCFGHEGELVTNVDICLGEDGTIKYRTMNKRGWQKLGGENRTY